jgi:hypothetical protein
MNGIPSPDIGVVTFQRSALLNEISFVSEGSGERVGHISHKVRQIIHAQVRLTILMSTKSKVSSLHLPFEIHMLKYCKNKNHETL